MTKNGRNVAHLSKYGQLIEEKFKPNAISFSEYLNDQITDSLVIKLTNTEEAYQEIKKPSLIAKQLVQTAYTPQW